MTNEDTKPADQVSLWGLRRTGTNVAQLLIDEHTSADPIQHEDAWKHGYPHQTTPGAVNLVVARHPLAWIQSRESWDYGGRTSLLARLLSIAKTTVNRFRDPAWRVSVRWGMPLDLYAGLYRAWLDLPRVRVLRHEDLVQDPARALSVLEHDGIHVDEDIQLPRNQVRPTNDGPTETQAPFDASYYRDHAWARHYSDEELQHIWNYAIRHGHHSLWDNLGYRAQAPWTAPPGVALSWTLPGRLKGLLP